MALTLSRFLLRCALAVRRADPIHLALLALCLIAVGGWLTWIPSLRHGLAAKREALTAVSQSRVPRQTAGGGESLAAQRLAAFYANLGESQYAEQQIRTLFGLAGKNGLQLQSADYRLKQQPAGQFETYQIDLPVKGSYATLRQFCEALLLRMPFVSLDEVRLRRDAAGSPTVEAQLRLTVFLRPDAGARTERGAFDEVSP